MEFPPGAMQHDSPSCCLWPLAERLFVSILNGYESERLANQLMGAPLAQNAHNLAKQSAKMAYVGFSRPTHLLCFAIHETRFAALVGSIDTLRGMF